MARQTKQRPSNMPLGPFSKDRRIVQASVDRRSKVGRLFRTTIADLSDQVGGKPTPAQSLIIQSAALKACRLYLLSEKLLHGSDMAEASDHHALAWLNSLRLDLTSLGLERRMKDVGPSLADILAGSVEDEPDDELTIPPNQSEGASEDPGAGGLQ